MLEKLKKEVCEANLALVRHGLVVLTWGNASGIDKQTGYIVIKPSGLPYDEMSPEDMVVVNLNGGVVEGRLKPSSDTPSHIALYNAFKEIGGVVHTHSTYAASCAQAGVPLTPLGTTQADYFYKSVPVTRDMTEDEINGGYELNTGRVIVETVKKTGGVIDTPCALVRSHGPFTWGADAAEAVLHAVVLEESAKMFVITKLINLAAPPVQTALMNKHFFRKHGDSATYGQKNNDCIHT